MKLLTISNLHPRPDRPQAGMFNAQLFRELAKQVGGASGSGLRNLVLVPEWRLWRWAAIRRWQSPVDDGPVTTYCPVAYVPVVGRSWSAATYAWSRRDLVPAIRNADVVLTVWLYPDGVVAARLAREAGKPVWVMVLGSDAAHLNDPARRAAVRDAARTVSGWICVSAPLARQLTAAGIDPGRVHVIPNGVDRARFHHRDARVARRELGADWPAEFDQVPVILFVGNLVTVKAPDVLLSALSNLERAGVGRGAEARLVVIGAGPLRRALEAQARTRGLAARIRFVGTQSHARMPLWMAAADCLCLCSRSEGMPNVVLEALACGTPVVATNVGACPDMLAGEPASRLVQADDPAGLARALGEVLGMSVDRVALAERHGRRSWQDQAADVLRLLQSAAR